jgi:hypothetical protein
MPRFPYAPTVGAGARMFQRIKLTLLTGLGSSSARGQLDVLDVTQRVKNDWAEYRGMMNVPLTFGQVTDFLRYKYDLSIDLAGQFGVIKPGARMSKEQFQRFATEIARLLIRGGAVTFARDVPEGDRRVAVRRDPSGRDRPPLCSPDRRGQVV